MPKTLSSLSRLMPETSEDLRETEVKLEKQISATKVELKQDVLRLENRILAAANRSIWVMLAGIVTVIATILLTR